LGSLLVSAQPVAQQTWGGVHAGDVWHKVVTGVHVLDTQSSPGGHALPHAPQLFTSLVVSMQPVPQHCSGGAHAGPPLHVLGGMHML
jgi:hypothetical protein